MATHSTLAVRGDQRPAHRRAARVCAEIGLSIAAGAIVALMIASVGEAMPRLAAEAALEPFEIRVIESDLAEPFVVCTTRAEITTCGELDLSAAVP